MSKKKKDCPTHQTAFQAEPAAGVDVQHAQQGSPSRLAGIVRAFNNVIDLFIGIITGHYPHLERNYLPGHPSAPSLSTALSPGTRPLFPKREAQELRIWRQKQLIIYRPSAYGYENI